MKKKKYKLKKWVKVVILILIILVATILTTIHRRKTTIKSNSTKVESKNKKQIIKSKSIIKMKAEEPVQEENAQLMTNSEENMEEMHNEIQKTVQNSEFLYENTKKIEEHTSYETRMTSYYEDDGYGTGDTTATGLGTSNFQTNENGWYAYQGKLVIATASNRLGATSMRTYNLYDELTLVIDGIEYNSIVLDVCGACQRHNRIDLFVSGSWAVKDTMITVKE